MCQSKADGGERCAAHTGQELTKAMNTAKSNPSAENNAELMKAMEAYNRTKTGTKELKARGDNASVELAEKYEAERASRLNARRDAKKREEKYAEIRRKAEIDNRKRGFIKIDPSRGDYTHQDTGTRFDPAGFGLDGFDFKGFDAEGYDSHGNNDGGFNREGIHRITKTNRDNWGLDIHGYDAEGYDSRGWDINGINMDTGTNEDDEGMDREGYFIYDTETIEGFNAKGRDWNGFDRNGIHGATGTKWNKKGIDKNDMSKTGWYHGYDIPIHKDTGMEFDVQGYDRQGYDPSGYAKSGFNRKGHDRDGNRRPAKK